MLPFAQFELIGKALLQAEQQRPVQSARVDSFVAASGSVKAAPAASLSEADEAKPAAPLAKQGGEIGSRQLITEYGMALI